MSYAPLRRTTDSSRSTNPVTTRLENSLPNSQQNVVKALYFVTADADPNLLPRLIEPFAKLGFVPDRVHADREEFQNHTLRVDLRLAGLSNRYAMLIEKALRSVIGVQSVITVLE
jgi:hypothetical protein